MDIEKKEAQADIVLATCMVLIIGSVSGYFIFKWGAQDMVKDFANRFVEKGCVCRCTDDLYGGDDDD